MAKKKRSANRLAKIDTGEAGRAVKESVKGFSWQRALRLLLATVLVFAVYEALISLEASFYMPFSVVMLVYVAVVTVLACIILYLNHGVSAKEITPEMFRDEDGAIEDEEGVRAFCEKVNADKKKAKKLMPFLIPFALTLLLDVFYLFWGDFLSQIFSVF